MDTSAFAIDKEDPNDTFVSYDESMNSSVHQPVFAEARKNEKEDLRISMESEATIKTRDGNEENDGTGVMESDNSFDESEILEETKAGNSGKNDIEMVADLDDM